MEDDAVISVRSESSRMSVMTEDKISFPTSHFMPVKIGEFRSATFLERLIEKLEIKSNKYILHTQAYYIAEGKKNEETKDTTLLLATDFFYFSDNEFDSGVVSIEPETFSYLEVDKVEENKEKGTIKLVFYKTAKNEKDPPYEMEIVLPEDSLENDILFKCAMIFRRQQSKCWQRYIEEKMHIRSPEIYQFHCFAYKVTTRDRFENRYLVLSNIFLYNVKMKSENSRLGRRVLSFNENLWYHPIEAVTKLEIEPGKKKSKTPILLTIHFDLELQNKVLVNLKRKKQKKTDRTFGFDTYEECRLAMFQIMRIFDDATNDKEIVIESKFQEEVECTV